MTDPFKGFPPDALAFFDELELNNNRTWWLDNKARFDTAVAAPMQALLAELSPTYGTFRTFRMNRDVRFSKDKAPYKTAHASMTETELGAALYVQFSGSGLFVGGGIYHPAKDQLDRYREAVADDRLGPQFEKAIAAVRSSKVDVGPGGDELKTAPRGYDKDHPRIELLRWKGAIASKDLGTPKWLQTARAAKEVAAVWTKAAPVIAWLDTNVGASQLAPPE